MTRRAWRFAAAWGLCAWCLSTAAACGDRDVVTSSYATLQEAAAEGALARGSVPQGLPPGTREIRVAWDQSSARRWGLFEFPPAERAHLETILEREVSFDHLRCNPPRRIEWWPVQLRGDLDAERLLPTGLQVYDAGALVVVVHWQQGRAYYWSREA